MRSTLLQQEVEAWMKCGFVPLLTKVLFFSDFLYSYMRIII
jgi:hypothetical protein